MKIFSMKTNRVRHFWLGLFLALILLLPGLNVAQAQEKTLYWERYDVNLTVQPNSDILVEEIQQIAFTSGTFTFGFAAIPLGRVERISDLQVSEIINGSERAYTPNSSGQYGFTTNVKEGELEITWYFPSTGSSTHTYILRYRVIGGLRIYEGGDQLWWKAIPPDHNFPIREAKVTATLPQTFPKDQLTVASYGAPADTPSYTDQGQVVFTVRNLPADQELEVRVQFPHGVVQGSPPAWQAADDRKQQWGPVIGVIFGGLGLVILLGGPLAVYLLWYKRGRDLPVGVVPEYISEPPDDLPAPIAGALVDEKADLQDIISTITDLARRGVLRLEEQQKEGFLGIGSGREYTFHLEDAGKATHPYEQTLLQGIFSGATERRMADLRQRFYTHIPTLQAELYDELVRSGFFPSNPNSTRRNWMGLGVVALIASFAIACGLLMLLGDFSSLAICPGLALIATAVGLIIAAPHMPRKTSKGVEEAAKWLAFKRYLQTIEKHGDLAEVKDKFEEFLPYGIAFGLERSLINKFKAVDTPAPSWWGPVIYPRYGGYGYPHHGGSMGGPAAGPAGGPPGPLAGEGGMPSLAGMSEGVGASLASMSEGLGAMLSSASSTLTSTPPPQTSSGGGFSGGGFSGGGFSGGGGGGGGSRGFG